MTALRVSCFAAGACGVRVRYRDGTRRMTVPCVICFAAGEPGARVLYRAERAA